MQIKEMLIDVNPKTRPGTHLVGVKGIVVHYTAVPGSTARKTRKWFSMQKDTASAHYAVDDDEIIRIIPENEIAYHVGADLYTIEAKTWLGSYPNNCTIGIEMCIDGAGEITAATRARTIDLVVDLLRRYKLTHTDVWRHYDVTFKLCPKPWVTRTSAWFDFLGAVQMALTRPANSKTPRSFHLARPGTCIPA